MSKLLGVWKSDPEDVSGYNAFGVFQMEFKSNGELIYVLYEKAKTMKFLLTYEIDGNFIISDQPSAPAKIRTEYNFLPDGKLELTIDGVKAKLIKQI